jgi:hypothetical protein
MPYVDANDDRDLRAWAFEQCRYDGVTIAEKITAAQAVFDYITMGLVPGSSSGLPVSEALPQLPVQFAGQDTVDHPAAPEAHIELPVEAVFPTSDQALSSQSPVVGLDTATVAEPGADANSASGEG